MRLVFSQVIVDALQIRCSGRGPANPHQEFSIRSMRASISPSSIKSFLSAWAIPSRTAPRNRASCSSKRKAASLTNASVSVPAWLAIWVSRASCSGVKWTSKPVSTKSSSTSLPCSSKLRWPSAFADPVAEAGPSWWRRPREWRSRPRPAPVHHRRSQRPTH